MLAGGFAEEIVAVLVERLLALALLAFVLFICFAHTHVGRGVWAQVSSAAQNSQAWVSDQHSQLHVGGVGHALNSVVDGMTKSTQSALQSGAQTFINASN